ncbi:hypothetical protein [Streptomyces sp. NPDC003393]
MTVLLRAVRRQRHGPWTPRSCARFAEGGTRLIAQRSTGCDTAERAAAVERAAAKDIGPTVGRTPHCLP